MHNVCRRHGLRFQESAAFRTNREYAVKIAGKFRLANQHVQDKNLEVSINHFLDILKAEGVKRIETLGKEFNPAEMEAIATAEGEDGKVIAELRAGFTLNEKLLRAAQVTVGQKE